MPKEENLKRRTVLKASGATAVFGTFGGLSRSVRAAPSAGEELATTRVVDVGLSYRNAPDEPASHTDDVADYVVDSANGKLVLNRPVSDADVDHVRANDFVAKGESFFAAPGTAFGYEATGLPAGPTHELELAEPHALPEIGVEPDSDGSATVRAAGRSRTVEPDASGELALPEVEVSVRPQSDELVEVEDERRGTTQMVRKRGDIETVTVQPVVEAVNLGQVDVHAETEVSDR